MPSNRLFLTKWRPHSTYGSETDLIDLVSGVLFDVMTVAINRECC